MRAEEDAAAVIGHIVAQRGVGVFGGPLGVDKAALVHVVEPFQAFFHLRLDLGKAQGAVFQLQPLVPVLVVAAAKGPENGFVFVHVRIAEHQSNVVGIVFLERLGHVLYVFHGGGDAQPLLVEPVAPHPQMVVLVGGGHFLGNGVELAVHHGGAVNRRALGFHQFSQSFVGIGLPQLGKVHDDARFGHLIEHAQVGNQEHVRQLARGHGQKQLLVVIGAAGIVQAIDRVYVHGVTVELDPAVVGDGFAVFGHFDVSGGIEINGPAKGQRDGLVILLDFSGLVLVIRDALPVQFHAAFVRGFAGCAG